MATVINNPATPAPLAEGSNGLGFVLGIILLVALAFVFIMYGLPYMTRGFQGPQVNVPGKVDVNVHTPGK